MSGGTSAADIQVAGTAGDGTVVSSFGPPGYSGGAAGGGGGGGGKGGCSSNFCGVNIAAGNGIVPGGGGGSINGSNTQAAGSGAHGRVVVSY